MTELLKIRDRGRKKIAHEEKQIQRLAIMCLLFELRITQKELSVLLGTSGSMVSNWRRGTLRISPEMADKMAALSKYMKPSDFYFNYTVLQNT